MNLPSARPPENHRNGHPRSIAGARRESRGGKPRSTADQSCCFVPFLRGQEGVPPGLSRPLAATRRDKHRQGKRLRSGQERDVDVVSG